MTFLRFHIKYFFEKEIFHERKNWKISLNVSNTISYNYNVVNEIEYYSEIVKNSAKKKHFSI